MSALAERDRAARERKQGHGGRRDEHEGGRARAHSRSHSARHRRHSRHRSSHHGEHGHSHRHAGHHRRGEAGSSSTRHGRHRGHDSSRRHEDGHSSHHRDRHHSRRSRHSKHDGKDHRHRSHRRTGEPRDRRGDRRDKGSAAAATATRGSSDRARRAHRPASSARPEVSRSGSSRVAEADAGAAAGSGGTAAVDASTTARLSTTSRRRVDDAQEFMERQIAQRTAKDMDVQRRVFQLFGRAVGLTAPLFKHHLYQSFGVKLSEAEARALFARYDRDGNGVVSLPEFVRRVRPVDYPGGPESAQWMVKRQQEIEASILRGAAGEFVEPTLDDLPAACEGQRPSVEEYARILGEKLLLRVRRPEEQYRKAYVRFGSPENGVDLALLRRKMKELGIVINAADSRALFEAIDADGSGIIDFPELMERVMPKDYTAKTWVERRADELAQLAIAPVFEQPVLAAMPKSLEQFERGDLHSVRHWKSEIYERIVARTKRPEDQYRGAYHLFESPAEGVTFPDFCRHVRRMGMVLDDATLRRVFDDIDEDGSGALDFRELVSALMPPEYTRKPWTHARVDEIFDAAQREASEVQERTLSEWPKTLPRSRYRLAEVEQLLYTKLFERTRRPADQYRQAYKLFGAPHAGITLEDMKRTIKALGLVLDHEEVLQLFQAYDENSNGKIEFRELMARLAPKDFVDVPWNIARDLEARAEEAKLQAKRASESPFGANKVPGHAGLTSFATAEESTPLPPRRLHRQDGASATGGSTSGGGGGDGAQRRRGRAWRKPVRPAGSSLPVKSAVDVAVLEAMARRAAGRPAHDARVVRGVRVPSKKSPGPVVHKLHLLAQPRRRPATVGSTPRVTPGALLQQQHRARRPPRQPSDSSHPVLRGQPMAASATM